jgi:hypothetical protein
MRAPDRRTDRTAIEHQQVPQLPRYARSSTTGQSEGTRARPPRHTWSADTCPAQWTAFRRLPHEGCLLQAILAGYATRVGRIPPPGSVHKRGPVGLWRHNTARAPTLWNRQEGRPWQTRQQRVGTSSAQQRTAPEPAGSSSRDGHQPCRHPRTPPRAAYASHRLPKRAPPLNVMPTTPPRRERTANELTSSESSLHRHRQRPDYTTKNPALRAQFALTPPHFRSVNRAGLRGGLTRHAPMTYYIHHERESAFLLPGSLYVTVSREGPG